MSWGAGGHGSTPWGGGGAAPVAPPVSPGARPRGTPVNPEDLHGVDVDCIEDATADFRLARGRRNLANAIARRLSTPRGGLRYDPEYGLDLREFLNEDVTGAEIANAPGEITLEVEKDPRVQAARVRLVYNFAASSLRVTIGIVDALGPFTLVLSVSKLTVEILDAQ